MSSDELRNPLATLAVAVSTLNRSSQGDIVTRSIGLLRRGTRRLRCLIAEVFDLARTATGKFSFDIADFSLFHGVREAHSNQAPMARSSSRVENRIASLALAMIDLRADFEAQLRTLARAEEALVKCRITKDPAVFDSSATALRGEVEILSGNNRSVRAVIDQMDLDARELMSPDKQ